MISKAEAISSLRPNSEWSLYDNSVLVWHDTQQTQPTDAEIDAEVIRLQAEYDAQQYARSRALEYPAIGDQLDMLWHAIDTESLDKTSDFYTSLKQVKDNNPKPE